MEDEKNILEPVWKCLRAIVIVAMYVLYFFIQQKINDQGRLIISVTLARQETVILRV